MDKEALKFIELLNHLSPDVNPYLEAANTLEASVHSPPSPAWSRRLRIALLVLTEVMLFQSSFLLYQRFRIGQYPKPKCNNLGLVIINISYVGACCFFSYSILTIYTLLVQIALDLGRKMDEALMLVIFGLKFLTVILGSWAFLWVCACQCALVLWHSDLASRMNRDLLKNLIKWGTSLLFILSALGPVPVITWQYVEAYNALHQIESIAHDITKTLRSKASSYDPHQFNSMSILTLLIPAKQIIPLQDRLESSLRLGQKLYLLDLGFLSLVYLPLLIISLRNLYMQSVSQAAIEATTFPNQRGESVITRRICHQRRRLVHHALCVYFSTSIHLPIVIFEIILSSSRGFVRSVKWHQLTFQGLTAPLAFSGNLILLILNIHSYLILKEKTRPLMQNMNPSDIKASDLNLFQKISTLALGYISHSEEVVIGLEDLKTNEKDQTITNHDRMIKVKDQKTPDIGIKITQSRPPATST